MISTLVGDVYRDASLNGNINGNMIGMFIVFCHYLQLFIRHILWEYYGNIIAWILVRDIDWDCSI